MIIGPHISIAKGFYKAGCDALSVGANTFQFFTRNPRGGNAKDLDKEDIQKLADLMEKNNFGPLLAHAPYTLNPASDKEKIREFAIRVFCEDLARLEQLPCSLYNFHPGSHVGQGVDLGIDFICEILNETMSEQQSTMVLLETMSGKGSEIGKNFEEIARIIDGVSLKEKIGVCMDTCHLYSSGYNIVDNLESVLAAFDKIVGLSRLKAMHLNDSLMPFACNKDRHEKLGNGSIGIKTFKDIVTQPCLKELPLFLETPQKNFMDYKQEIDLLHSFA